MIRKTFHKFFRKVFHRSLYPVLITSSGERVRCKGIFAILLRSDAAGSVYDFAMTDMRDVAEGIYYYFKDVNWSIDDLTEMLKNIKELEVEETK